jgi:ubiquinone/menaquinone biosynthesis C-methylase UbiE
MRQVLEAMIWLCLSLTLWLAAVKAEESPREQKPAPYAGEMNKKFADPNSDIEQFVKRFESEGRDVYAKRQSITRAVGLQRGNAVADIGAGTGLFTQLFAEQVGPEGIVYAVDIGPGFLRYIAERAKQHGHERIVKTVLNSHDSVELPAGSIDVAFLCNTYHHFEQPEKMLASIHRALRPGGRLVIIDFDLRKDSSEFVRQRARAPKEVYYREIAAAGFEAVKAKDAPAISNNFYGEFLRVERKP